ncbi:beta strand repeat-containing protein [Prosthecobacter sp.]|uniref:beta strand repeat-containing protein n=1 Tax=Prosthecobacter sp. TaxID=1965333 RepID=UPI003783F7F3
MTQNLFSRLRLVVCFLSLGALFILSRPLNAATFYWDSDGSVSGNNAVLGTNLGGTGTWDAASLLWYNALNNTDGSWPNVTSDTAVFYGTAGTVTLASGGANTGSLQFLTTGYSLTGAQLTLGGSGSNLFVGSAVTTTINAAVAGSNGLGLYGPGTLNLSALNQYTGSTTLSNGATLNLDFTTNATNLIQSSSPLVLNGGTLKLSGVSGATDSQTFAGTSVTGGGVVTLTQNAAASLTAALGVITQSTGGSLNFSVVPLTSGVIATTTNTNVNGILGTWASVGSGTSGLSYATVNGSNQIIAYTGGTTAATAASLSDTTGSVNYNLTTATGTVAATVSANTIRYTGAAATTAPGATSFTVNGLMNSGSGVWTIGTATITIGASRELEIITGTNGITITSVIQNNAGGASSLTYSGTGTLTLSKANTYTGTTTVNSGTLNLGIAAALNSASSLVVNGGTFGEATFADTVASVVLRNGSITGTTGVLTSTAAFDLQSGTVSAPLGGTAGLNKTTPGTVTLSPTTAGTLTGAINVKAGTLNLGGTVVPFSSANTITLGDTTGSADARLAVSNTNGTYANPIVLSSGTTGILSIGNQGATAISFTNATAVSGSNNLYVSNTSTGGLTLANVANSGTVTNAGSGTGLTTISALGAGVTGLNQAGASPLTLTPAWPVSQLGATITNSGSGLLTLSGGVTGGTGLVFNTNGTGGITVASTSNTGAITASGTGTGTTTLTTIGAGVTSLNLTGTGALTLTPAWLVSQFGSTFTNNGAGLLTLTGGVTGGTNLVFNATSTGGITVTAAMTSSGTITNSGAGAGNVTLTAAIPSTVTDIVQNSGGTLTLTSAANAYTGTTTVTSGILSFAGTPATGATSGLGNSTTNIVLGGASTSGTLVYTGSTATMTRGITINAGGGEIDSTTGTLTITPGGVLTAGTLTIAPAGNLTFGGANNITLGGATANVPLISGTNALTKVGSGTLTLSMLGGNAPIQSAMPINITAGTLALVSTNVSTTAELGTGLITITPGATLTAGFGGATATTLTNAITIAAASGTANITVTSGAFQNASGAITFAAGSTAATILKLNNSNGATATLNLGGTVTGTGTIQLNPSSGGSPIILSGAQNQTGSISNVGTSTSTVTLSGLIGSGISAISQAGANPFTVSSAVPLSAGLNTFTSTGTGLWTFSGGFTGTQPLTFNANSSGGITVSTTAISSVGTITNSGTGGGVTTITASIGSGVTNILQSGANTQLVLSGTNSYTGTATVTGGILDYASTLAIPGYSTSPATAFGTFASPKIIVASGTTLVLPFGGPNSITATDFTNLLNGTYNVLAPGSSLGLDTTNASANPAILSFVLSDPGGAMGVLNFTKSGANALTTGTANTYTGTTSIVNGTLNASIINSVNGGTPLFASGSLGAPVTVANGTIHLGFGATTGTLSYIGSGETTDRVVDLSGVSGGGGIDNSGSGLLTLASPVTFTGTGAKTLTLSGAGNINFSSAIAGNASTGSAPLTIAKAGAGTVTLSGANTATTLTISGGVLDTGAGGLSLSNLGTSTVVATGSGTINGKIFLGATNAASNGPDYNAAAGVTLTINAVIANGASSLQNIDFNSVSGGVVILAGANTFTGQVQINGAGTLQVSSINSVVGGASSSSLGVPSSAANGTILLNTGGILKYTGTGETTDRIISLNGTTTGGTIDQSGTGLLKFSTNFATPGSGAKTFVLQGSTTGTGEIAGAITQNSTTNTTTLTKAGTGTWTVSGVNSYTGATNVNGGNLILSQGSGGTGTMSNTGIVINSGGMLSPLGGTSGYTVGNTATAAAGGRLTLNAGGVLNMADGVVNPLVLVQNSTFSGNAATFTGGVLNFDIGAASADQIDVRLNNVTGTGQATSSGLNAISISIAAGALSLTPGSYTLISANAAGSTLNNANFYLASSNLNVGGTLYQLSLSGTTGSEVLTVAVNSGAAVTPNTAFWNGTYTGSWAYQPGGNGTATNWSAAAIGTPDTYALPGSVSNVAFAANNATNLSTTLDQNFIINSLLFTGSGTTNTAGSTIASGAGVNTLTINAGALSGNTAGNGITLNAGAGASLISAGIVLGSSQTWTNNASNSLTVSGAIGDGGGNFNLNIAGTGSIILSSASSTYGGTTTINAGSTLRVSTLANGGLPSSIGQSSSAAGNLVISGSFLYNGTGSTSDRAFTINAGATATIGVAGSSTLTLAGATGAVTTGLLTKTDTGTLVLTGAQTYTGNTVVSAGTLNFTGTSSLTGLAASTKLSLTPTAGNTSVVNYNSTGTSTLFAVTGASVAGTASGFYQTAGLITISPGTSNQNVVGGTSAYGYYSITGGTFKDTARFTLANKGTASATNGTGTGVQTGVVYIGGTGILDQTSADWYLNYSLGQTTVADSGKIDRTGSTTSVPFGLIMDTPVVGGSYGVLNLAGSGAQVLLGAGGMKFGNNSNAGNGDGNSGFVNLAAGLLSTSSTTAVSLPAAPTAPNYGYWNYAGGTMRATANLTSGWTPASAATITFIHTIYGAINNSAVSGAPSFNGGLTIDTNSFNVSVPAAMPLLGATGFRVTQDDLTVSGGSGYIGAPAVIFSKPASATGVPASGYALISGGSVVGIVITDPGVYAAGETPTITLVGGGASVAATVTSAPLSTANSSAGGLTKVGTGTLTMSGTGNTFGGPVDIKGGVLAVSTITNGGAASSNLGTSSSAASNLLLDGGILSFTGTAAGSTDRGFTIAATNTGLDASGTTAGTLTLTSTSALAVSPGLGNVNFILQGTGTGTAGAGSLSAPIPDGTGTVVSLIKNGSGTWTLAGTTSSYSGSTTINGGILSVSSLSAGGTPSSIGDSSNAASNLVLSGGTLLYTGSGSTTDRNYTFGNATTASGFTIDSEGTGALVITGGMTGVNSAANTQILSLIAGAGTGSNTINGIVDSNAGAGALTGVTKTGAGLWIIGSSSYSGATTLTAGTLQYAGSSALQGSTSISQAAGTFLQIRDDAATINHVSNNVNVTSAGVVTIDVGSNGGATTGSTVALGALNNGTAANALATTFNFTGSNGYRQSYSSLALAGSTGANTTLNPTTASVTITGNITSQLTNATAHWDNLILDGTSAGNAINGVISDSAVYVSVGNGDTRLTKQNSSTWTLGGASTYTGGTAVNAGTLALSSTGSLGNTAITVANGAVFAPTPGTGTTSAGSTGAGTLGATLTINSNGTLSMVDGSIGTFLLNTNTSFAGAALTLASANLNLDLSSAGVDQLIVSGNSVASVISGTNTISVSALGTSLTPGTYAFLTAPGIAAGNTLFKFDNGTTSTSLTVGMLSYQLNLASVAGIEQLVVGAGVGNLSWTGQTNGAGAANSVWSPVSGGNNNFADLSPAAVDYSEGSAVTFQDLNVISGGNVTNATVTVAAGGVQPGNVTVNNTAVNYTFQNAGGSVGISGSSALTKTGAGTLTLLGQNTYTGATSINGGTVVLGVAEGSGVGPLGNGGVISFDGGILQYTAANQSDYSARLSSASGNLVAIDTNGQNVTFATALTSPGGTLTKNGAGKLTLTGINTYSGNTTINAGTLTVTGANSSLGAMSSPTITVNAGAVLDLTNNDTLGYTAGRNVLVINGGTVQNNASGKRDTLINTVTMTGGSLSGTSLGDANGGAFSLNNATSVIATSDAAGNAAIISASISTQALAVFQVNRGTGAVASGAPDLIISGAIIPYNSGTNGVTFKGNGISTLSGANTYTGTTTLTSGTLIIGATNTIKTTNQLTFGTAASANVGALQLNAFSQTLSTILVTSNAVAANTISIGSGQTLTTGTLTMGYDAAGGTTATNSNLTVSGAGTFAISGATTVNISVNQAATNAAYYSQATLDVTNVLNFTAAVTTFNVGVGSSTTGNGTVLLSNTANTITATTLQVGLSGGNNGNGTSLLQFGSGTNVINASTINLGFGKVSSNVGFASHTSGSPGTLTIAGTAGGASTSNITIASNNGTGTAAIDTVVFDVTGHVVNIQAGTLQLGNGNNASSGGAVGTLSFDAGTVSALNTSLGLKSGTAGTGAGTGTLNIGGGTFTVKTGGSMVLATNSATTGSANGTINITGSGTLSANADITKGGGNATTATLTLNGATALLDMSGGGSSVHNIGSATAVLNTFTFTNGTLRNFGIIYGGITLAGSGERVFDETGTFGGQVNGIITGTGVGIDKTGTGTIALLGANSFTGNIDIDAGTLVANLSNNSVNPASSALGNMQVARTISVNNGGTLQFSSSDSFGGSTSTVAATLVINAGGTVTNDSTGEFNTLGPVQLKGGTLTGVKGSGSSQAQMYSLQGSVTVSGTMASTISGPAAGGTTYGGYHLSANTSFNVADATGDAGSDLLVSGVLMDQPNSAGAGGLTKSGAGTMTVTSTSVFSGTTTVSAGTLQVGTNSTFATASVGAGSGAVNVSAGAALAGTGIVGGAASTTTIASGAVLLPGDGTALGMLTNSGLNIGGNLTVDAGGQIQLQIDSPTLSGSSSGYDAYLQSHPGATALDFLNDPANASSVSTWNAALVSGSNKYDYLNVGGTLTLGHAAHEVSVSFNTYSAPTYGDVFNLLDWTTLTGADAASLAGAFSVATDLDLSAIGGSLGWDTSAFTRYGIIVAAPEPGRAWLFLFGLFGFVMRRRRTA